MSDIELSALVVVHNEEARIAACLERLSFADEIVVVLDKCTDGTEGIAQGYTDQFVEGAWELEGPRRNAGIDACNGCWILEVDADEWVPPALAAEIRQVIKTSQASRHLIFVDNYVGKRLVRHGWGASFGKAAYPGLFRKGSKVWGDQRLHPSLTLTGQEGPALTERLIHWVDRDTSDMLRRLNGYSTARAKDLLDSGNIGSLANNIRRFFSRFVKCYWGRKGYREGRLGLLIALCAGLYPLLSYLKAATELENKSGSKTADQSKDSAHG
ncbi:glycosyltransferase family 2 protein [Rhodovibrionaceae bacterium A322]